MVSQFIVCILRQPDPRWTRPTVDLPPPVTQWDRSIVLERSHLSIKLTINSDIL